MASVLANQSIMDCNGEDDDGRMKNGIPPMIKALLEDISNIRRTALVESPAVLPLLAPSLIEAEIHIRQLWASQY